jgi:hypothetical protein
MSRPDRSSWASCSYPATGFAAKCSDAGQALGSDDESLGADEALSPKTAARSLRFFLAEFDNPEWYPASSGKTIVNVGWLPLPPPRRREQRR